MATSEAILATGRRKTSVSSVRLLPGPGKIEVNGRAFEDYFPTISAQSIVRQPLEITNHINNYQISVTTKGGGVMAQAAATRMALARALTKIDEQLRPALKAEGCLRRDPRMKERKKPGQPGARKRFQFSKR
ncbi:MAG: 30S ribosomal protein S9 [Verrucomicrobiales bacterium]